MELVEQQYGTGYVQQDLKPSDRVYAAGLAEPVDWYKGFNVQTELRKKLGSSFVIPVNNQGTTLSCVAQAWAKYAGIKKVISDLNPNWVEFSPRDVYSHIYLPQGGSYVMAGGLRCRNNGVLPNEQLPPYWSGKPNMAPLEEVYRDKGLEGGHESGDNANEDIYNSLRQLVKGGSIEQVGYDIESVARAIRDNYGVVLAVHGENNGTWLTKFPKVGSFQWGHAVLAIGYMYINGKKYIIILNSWGNGIGEGGYQWLGEEWFQQNGPMSHSYLGAANTWSPEVGVFHRVSDLEKLDKYITANYPPKLGDYSIEVPEIWNEIKKMTSLDITYSDYSAYKYLINLK
jgi:hypothetical protein